MIMKQTNKLMAICIMALMSMVTNVTAQTVEMDLKSAAQITYNTGVAAGHEVVIRDTVKLSRKRNDSIMAMATTITALKTFYHNARRNVMGFGKESAIYKQIKNKALGLMPKMGTAISVTLKNPFGIGDTYENILKIQRSINNLARLYSQVVSNGHADNPFKQDDRLSDGYNFLSSRDRYMLASSILTELNKIDWQLTIIIYASNQKSSKINILKCIDYKTYSAQWQAKKVCENMIDRINRLKDRVD